MQYQVSYLLFYSTFTASNGRSNLMLNTIKRDERRSEKALFKELLKERDMIQNLKKEVFTLQDELNKCNFDKAEANKNRDILANLYDKKIIDEFGNIE